MSKLALIRSFSCIVTANFPCSSRFNCYQITFHFLTCHYVASQSLNDKTEEMTLGAENFASLAEQLAKKYEKRKWWEF